MSRKPIALRDEEDIPLHCAIPPPRRMLEAASGRPPLSNYELFDKRLLAAVSAIAVPSELCLQSNWPAPRSVLEIEPTAPLPKDVCVAYCFL